MIFFNNNTSESFTVSNKKITDIITPDLSNRRVAEPQVTFWGVKIKVMATSSDALPFMHQALTVVVIGASGDLAKKKTYPSLFALYCGNLLPEHGRILLL